MSVSVVRKAAPAQSDWRDVLEQIGRQIAEEGRRQANEFVAANLAAVREHGFLALGVSFRARRGRSCPAPNLWMCCESLRITADANVIEP